jgi:undecaprenyl-diphosphatase
VDLDTHLFFFLHRGLSGWIGPMVVLSVIGGGWGSLLVVPLVAARRTRRLGASMAAVLASTAVLVFVLKRIVARARPFSVLAGVQARAFDPPTDYSFPSGHAAGSFAFAVFLAIVLVRTASSEASARERRSRTLGAIALTLLAAGVALSRVALGVHFPGDVLAGALLGSAIGAAGAHLYLRGPEIRGAGRLCLRRRGPSGQTTRRAA